MLKVMNKKPKTAARVYTRNGDCGSTSLVGGQRVSKSSLRIETYGSVDELLAFVGIAYESCRKNESLQSLFIALKRVMHQLFNISSILATLSKEQNRIRITSADILWLETEMDACSAELAPLRSFILPGGSHLNAQLHVCRTVCRRVERLLVRLDEESRVDPLLLSYINRLSDAFFVWSRFSVHIISAKETLWDPHFAGENH